MKNVFLIFLVSSLFSVQAQELQIHEIKLTDTILKNTISDYIKETKQNFPEFNSVGYIKVSIKSVNKPYLGKNLKRVYKIEDAGIEVLDKSEDWWYPNYYTHIDTKLVIIYNKTINDVFDIKYSKKSKRKFRRILEDYLPPKKKFKFRDFEGNGKTITEIFRHPTYLGSESYGIILEVYWKTHEIRKATHYD
ncbi:hypothetical protein [Xanthomarina spongicola]|uniref:Uncharacterized protein n=1 Tax=Xanthomarina spongicola TaxID=570520 RepID=A0A316EDC7_9FLAO|nr:hypothetical protein [Xanthomarina spongicola]PWK20940.1 hypothetical protein LX78_00647 [Xanthomarina spongicola]